MQRVNQVLGLIGMTVLDFSDSGLKEVDPVTPRHFVASVEQGRLPLQSKLREIMSASSVRLIKNKVDSFKANLERAPSKQQEGPISVALAENFNALMGEIATEFPAVASSLPKPALMGGLGWDMQLADVNYLDLHILTDQVLAILDAPRSQPIAR